MRLRTLALGALLAATAAAKDIHIGATYGLTPLQEKMQAKNLFANIGALKAKCANAYKHWNDLGVPDAVIMEQTLATVYGLDATWTGANTAVKFIGMPATNHNIAWPLGRYALTDTWRTSFGDNYGGGEFVYYPGNSTTDFYMWEEKWLGAEDVTDGGVKYKCLVVTPTWGDNGTLGYAEGWSIQGIRLTGPGHDYANPAYSLVGLGVWDMGEMGSVDVRSDEWDIGVMIVRGTPFLAVKTTVFNNNIAGVYSAGGSLGGGAFVDVESCDADSLRKFLSGDDNGRLFMARAGFGRPGGGQWVIVYTKGETAVTGEDRGRWTGMPLVDAQGLFGITMYGVNASSGFINSDALFILDGQTYNSSFTGINIRHHNYRTEVLDPGNGFRVPAAPSFTEHTVTWSSGNGGAVYMGPTLPQATLQTKYPTPCKSRLGFQRYVNGVATPPWDDQRCLPAYSDYGPVTNPPTTPCSATWVLGPKQCTTCSNGSQVCTEPYVSSGTCQPTTPKPGDLITSQACTTTPVGTKQPLSNVTSTMQIPCTLATVKRITYTKLRIPVGTNIAAFAGYVCDKVYVGFGGIYYNNPHQVQAATVTLGKNVVNKGSTTTLTIEFATPVTMKWAVGSDGVTVPFTAEKVVLE